MRTRTAPIGLDEQLGYQVDALRRLGLTASEICDQLEIHKSSECRAITEHCAKPHLRRYQVGIDSGPSYSPHRIRAATWA